MERTRRTLKITFADDVSVFEPVKYKLFKKMVKAIYGSKVIGGEDGKETI